MRPLPSSKHDADDQADEVLVAVCVDSVGREAVFRAEDIEIQPGESTNPDEGPVRVRSETHALGLFGLFKVWNAEEIRFEYLEVDGGD